ncbi:MAG: hypothetical protein M1820_005578 [Bogoriella megaspora]|nr:MAG: hypothetical protein M1820_005578 [Bogoriella megaspora]
MPLPRTLLPPRILPLTTRRTLFTTPLLQHPGSSNPSGDYGSGTGDPKGENPQSQGANPSADKEHPGPPPPKAGQGTGGGPTKGTSKGHNTDESPSAAGQKRGFSTLRKGGLRGQDELRSKETKGAEPKILKDAQPREEEYSEDVKRHNREYAASYDKPQSRAEREDAEAGGDKVGKGFWSGHGGADRQP